MVVQQTVAAVCLPSMQGPHSIFLRHARPVSHMRWRVGEVSTICGDTHPHDHVVGLHVTVVVPVVSVGIPDEAARCGLVKVRLVDPLLKQAAGGLGCQGIRHVGPLVGLVLL